MIGSLLLAVGALATLVYGFLVWNFGHWRARGIKEPRALPLLGSFPNMVWPRQHFTMDMRDLYMKYRETDSYVGTFLLRSPKLLLLEPRLVYEVFVSAFRHFEDNDAARMVDTGKDVLVCCNPFVLEGNEWRQQRGIFSSLLTNGRIRTTHTIMQRVCRDLESTSLPRSRSRESRRTAWISGLRFSGDSLFDCVLGIQARCFNDSPLPLGRYPECQQRLYEELDKASPSKELPDLDELNDLPYLSACFNESLRIYPAGGWASKTCTEPYKLHGSHHSQPLQMLPGDNIMIPIYGLHHDPQFYPEPEEFRPERFLDGGLKRFKQMGVFLGFGNGPRQCVGMRLGLAQAKAALAAIVQRFEVRVHPRTADGLELDPYIFVGCHKGGIWLDFVARPV
ncbi:GL20201 [Drosophila persimilis]|uniref:GL20201 n=1 Tax=Drosophila persimilis TaxID=7234 RepID=B4GXU3_DROPE|nr:GL20201 [Drosophila persimilis]